MAEIHDIKQEQQKKVDNLINDCKVFFAFSNEQFHKNKTPLQEGEKYVSIGAGGYLPNGMAVKFKDGLDRIDEWYKSVLKNGDLRRQNIVYELINHEAFYTCGIEQTMDALGGDYTQDEVWNVYKEELNKR